LIFVIDASVAAKWFLPDEPFSALALELLHRATTGATDFIVPDLFFSECGNILWKAARRRRLSAEEAQAAIQVIGDLQTLTVPASGLLERTLQIARTYDRTFYDSLYVAVAVQKQATLVTADEKLANATAAYLPVKWLGALQF
jgi:predicted nucleic acid-binding protein